MTPAAGKPFHPKRPHRKSRAGCRNCKTRKVKCDEGRPTCRTCTARNESCVYMAVSRRASPPSPPSPPSPASAASSPGKEPASTLVPIVARHAAAATVPQQPLFIPSGHSELDMRLLWFYSTVTYTSFSTGALQQRSVDVVLKVDVVQHAFANPFLMNCILGLSAQHINHLGLENMGISKSHEIYYRAMAFETYRKAVAAAEPATFPAMLATALLLCGLATHVFRGDEAVPLSIMDWMMLWKGIGAIIEVTKFPRLVKSGIARLIFRPEVDFDASSRCLPSYLLFMLSSIKEGDPEFPLVPRYYKALQYLGSLYRELRNGFSQMLLLRIVTFVTYLDKPFIENARERRPRALIILAHYLVFAKFRVKTCWWMEGMSDHEIPNISRFLGPEWAHLLRVPMAALLLDDDKDIARLLLDDPSWDVPTKMEDEPLTLDDERTLAIRAARGEDVTAGVDAYQDGKIGIC
ncbi:hypothetical protein C8A00DRAFT_42120 [Chaetomidium leptoderma]|uniref:Zn(2)-C6 fungal-type domain-containing protein n=1 Tax=Chaetomidium leptoderma TaxID=669021 RepID=A0AAN6VP75_9PEZI|nr:hypothetical protein C8A00DRAFT_42120 [Chaetomidium leptoderma]